MAPRIVSILCAVAVALALTGTLGVAAASADGDPASDVLLGLDVFYPYSPSTSAAAQKRLNDVTAAAKAAGYPIKVALIAAPTDLGVIPSLFGKPLQYAEFLDREISFAGVAHLLVVMADGYGVQGFNAAATAAIGSVARPTGHTPTALAESAVAAVARLASASGHPIKGIAGTVTSGSGSSSPALPVAILAIFAAGAAGTLIYVRRRPARASPSSSPSRRERRDAKPRR